MTYIVNLKVFDYTKWSLRIPYNLTPRFYPSTTFEENYWNESGYEAFFLKNKYTWSVNIMINWAGSIRNVASPTHREELNII